MKRKLPLLVLWMVLAGQVMSQGNISSFAEIEIKLRNLENEVALQKREIAVQIQEAQTSSAWNTVFHVAAILLAIASGPVLLALRAHLDKKRLEGIAEAMLKAQMDERFPALAKKEIDDYLKKNVPGRIASITGAANDHEAETKLRTLTPILVVADNHELATKRAEFLRNLGYKDVRTSLPEKYEKLPTHTICFIEHPGKEGSYSQLTNRYIQALINDFSSRNPANKGLFFYFGSRCEGLNFALLEKKGICNMEGTMDRNLLDLSKQLETQK